MRRNPLCPKCNKQLLSVCYRQTRKYNSVPKVLRNYFYCESCNLVLEVKIKYVELTGEEAQ